MKNVEDLSAALSAAYTQLQTDGIDDTKADALANIAGKLIKLKLGQLTYYDQRKSTPVLAFWEQQESTS